ncbi:MAG: ribonuclease H-like domain-containing protein [Clostridiales bacterium]|nr:ribonuclease H-like domain-containing protein [Clostridiales bacterium]
MCETIVTSYGRDFRYGGFSAAELSQLDLKPFAALTGGELVGPGDLLFLDTETTGLSGGAGTVAFLIGVGYFCGDGGFLVKQYLMRDFDEEPAMLQNLALELKARGALVTYNGKAFDMNLLASRFIMNGARLPASGCHLDLLHVARRVWRECLENCRLVTLEESVLAERREGDIPGSLIPQVYFDYLENRERDLLDRVLLHNRLDILAMAAVIKYISDLAANAASAAPRAVGAVAAPESASAAQAAFAMPRAVGGRRWGELLGLAGLFESIGNVELAERCLGLCVERGGASIVRRALARLANLKKRENDYETAIRCWRRLLTFSPVVGLYPYIELAKYFEHKARDPETAKEYADQAQALANGPVFRDSAAKRELALRRGRLARKIARKRGRGDDCEHVNR